MTSGDMEGTLDTAQATRALVLLQRLREAGVDVERIKHRNKKPSDFISALDKAVAQL